MLTALLCLIGTSFLISVCLTAAMKRVSPRLGFVDKPGHRKIHHVPKPLGGGVAIFWAFALPLAGGLLYAWTLGDPNQPLIGGVRLQTPLAIAFLLACLALHVMGILDDRKALGPYLKLAVQLLAAFGLVFAGDLRALTAIGYWPSVIVTVVWIVAITNAFNFLDNMDGLSAGIAAVAATAFLIAAVSIGQWFVAGALCLLLGAIIGFLCFNFPPASIFMGDCGSLVVGFILGVLTVRTTFLPPDANWHTQWYSVLAPVIVLAVPLYDLLVVSVIRLRNGNSPFVGDTNHFSHRLVARGMSKRTAVLCLWLLTAATAIAAIILTQVRSGFGAALIGGQTMLILGVVMLLEQHPVKPPDTKD